jgi:hypothetical protein
VVTNNISNKEFETALIFISPDTEDLCGNVEALENNGLTLAQAVIEIADDQSRKPMSKAKPPNTPGTEQKKLG